MKESKEYLKQNNIAVRISFKQQPVHTVKLMGDKITEINSDGEIVKGVEYSVLEGGEPKTFFTSSDYLIQTLSEFPEGTTVKIEMKSKKGTKGFISFFDVEQVDVLPDAGTTKIEDL